MRSPLVVTALVLFSACSDPERGHDAADVAPGDTVATDVAADSAPADATPEDLCAPLALSSLSLRADGTALRDELGRAVWLRGVNAGGRAKVPPYLPFSFSPIDASAPPFDEALASYVDRVRAWGLDVIRLPFTWEAVEPTRGGYDEVFLGRLDAYVKAAGERGLRVVLDNHQDVFARNYCGDGFPPWTLADANVPRPPDCTNWFLNYYQNADMQTDFDRFWDNQDGLMDAFEAMWTMMVERYAAVPGVIGFEIINEPGWGTRDMNDFSRDVLTPFYTRMVTVVQAAAPHALVFVDPTGVDGILLTTSLGRPQGDGVVFAPHYYDGLVVASGDVSKAADTTEALRAWHDVGEAWQTPVWLGEFGVAHDLPGAAGFMRAHWEALDALGMHGTEWEYSVTGDLWNAESLSVVDSDGNEREIAAELMRAYPEALAGTLVSWHFDRATRRGELVLDADGTSWVAAPARLYPEGLDATIEDGTGCVRWDEGAGRLYVGGRGRLTIALAPR